MLNVSQNLFRRISLGVVCPLVLHQIAILEFSLLFHVRCLLLLQFHFLWQYHWPYLFHSLWVSLLSPLALLSSHLSTLLVPQASKLSNLL